MLSTMSRLFRNLGFSSSKPDFSVCSALECALEQRALFQLEIPLDTERYAYQCLSLSAFADDGMVLMSPEPFFAAAADWTGKAFRFRFLARPHSSDTPQLHMFKAMVKTVAEDKKTITVDLPGNILILEQRRNVRIKLRRNLLPDLDVWGATKNTDEATGVSLHQCVILELGAADEETAKVVKNLSAGGMRLSLAPQVFARNKSWLEAGRKLIVRLVFSGPDCPWPSKHVFVAKIINARTRFVSRPELGIQFLAARVYDPELAWKKLPESGCEELARVIHAVQLLYHTEAKLPPPARPGTPGDAHRGLPRNDKPV